MVLIKKRALCSLEERKDPNIVMPMCIYGCDALFEQGYINGTLQNQTLVAKHPQLCLHGTVPHGILRCIASRLLKPIHVKTTLPQRCPASLNWGCPARRAPGA